jgi:serine/threonine protein kinase
MSPDEGTVLSQRYTLTRRIAAGGMGEVWAATDAVLGRTVAVKLLNPALSQQSGFLDRFRAEARHAAALHHPNITTVFDYGEDDGSAYLVMERVAGQPLSEIIAERAPLSAQATASILIQAATALEAAHQGGVIHRDVKPANILVTPDGTAKLTDFGISRLVNTVPLTQTGEVLGTAQYLSPEQAMGQSATASSDIYALGVVGHEMLTGQRPFEADTMAATAFAHLNQPPPPLPDTVPVGIRSVISAALAKDPADRPGTAAAMAAALGKPDTTFASPSSVAGAVVDRTQAIPAPGGLAQGVSALGPAAQGLATPALSAQAVSPPTQVLSTQGMPDEPYGRPARRSRFRPAWLLGVAAAAAVGVVAAFALPGGLDSTGTPVVPSTTSPISEQTIAPESTSTTTEIAPPQESSSTPSPHDRGRGRGRGRDNQKDGKQ